MWLLQIIVTLNAHVKCAVEFKLHYSVLAQAWLYVYIVHSCCTFPECLSQHRVFLTWLQMIVVIVFVAVLPIEDSALLLIMEQNAEIKEQVKINTQMLQEQRGAETLKLARLPENLKLSVPIMYRTDLAEFEKRLQNHDTAKQMVCCCSILYRLFMFPHHCIMGCNLL